MRFRVKSLPFVLQMWSATTLLLGLLCAATERIARHICRFNRLPYNRLTLEPASDYVDLWMFNNRMSHFHTMSFFDKRWGSHFLYPAPLTLFYKALYFILGGFSPHPTLFLFFLVSIYVVLGLLLGLALRRRGLNTITSVLFILLALLTSYPFFFELNRANMEIFIWLIAGFGIFAFLRGRLWIAATCIGIAGACKLFPYIYVGLLLIRKRYWQAAWAFVVGGFTTLFSLWAVTGNPRFTAAKVAEGLREFREIYVLQIRGLEVGLDHSIFGLIKWSLPQTPSPHTMGVMLNVYLVIAAIAATCLFFLYARKMPVLNQITFLTVACIVLPPVSYDYTLLHVYTPWTLFVLLAVDRWHTKQQPSPGLLYAFICFILLLSPQNELILHGERLEGVIKCLSLLALGGITLAYPFEAGRPSVPIERSVERASERSSYRLSDSAAAS